MEKTLALVLAIFLMHQTIPCYALDWKGLHEEADKKEFSEAFSLAQENPQSVDDLYILGLIYLNLHKDVSAAPTVRR